MNRMENYLDRRMLEDCVWNKTTVSSRRAALLWMHAAATGCILSLQSLARDPGCPAEYLGGTLDAVDSGAGGSIRTNDPLSFVFQTRRTAVRIPYDRINQIEYGQKVDRRVLEAILISPLLVLAKKRHHFLTVGFEMDNGRQQAMLFKVDKSAIRAVLVSLEARTGRKVTYQDEEARKGGKG
jgi:hypothetical protein